MVSFTKNEIKFQFIQPSKNIKQSFLLTISMLTFVFVFWYVGNFASKDDIYLLIIIFYHFCIFVHFDDILFFVAAVEIKFTTIHLNDGLETKCRNDVNYQCEILLIVSHNQLNTIDFFNYSYKQHTSILW